MGLRALARVLDTYSTKHGINTIDALVNRYAPASDNTGGSHENYKQFLSQQLGIGINDPLDVKGQRANLMDAIIRFENKNRTLATQDQIQQAILAADNKNTPTVAQNINTSSGDNQMAANEGILSVEEDYKIGAGLNGAYFEYPENYIRYEKEKNAKNAINTDAPTSMGDAQLMRPFVDAQQAQQQPTANASDGVLSAVANMQLNGLLNDAIASPNTNDAALSAPSNTDQVPYSDAILDGRIPQNVINNSVGDAQMLRPFLNDPSINQAQPSNDVGNSSMLRPYVTDPSINQAEPKLQEQVTKMLPASGYKNYVQSVGNRRDKSEMSLSPTIDTNEMLMRVGLAGVGGSQKGGLQALSDMGSTYGAIQDANRSTALEAYKASLENKPDDNSIDADAQTQLAQMDAALFDMQRAKEFLKEEGIVGFFDNNIKGMYDTLAGNERAVGRKLLQKLRVDDTLLRIAQTKGAISNKEMDLFLAPTPTLNDQESVWLEWIDQRMAAIQRVRARLSGGERLPEGDIAQMSQINTFSSEIDVSPNVQAARDALKQ